MPILGSLSRPGSNLRVHLIKRHNLLTGPSTRVMRPGLAAKFAKGLPVREQLVCPKYRYTLLLRSRFPDRAVVQALEHSAVAARYRAQPTGSGALTRVSSTAFRLAISTETAHVPQAQAWL
jgi:hypothetical protein